MAKLQKVKGFRVGERHLFHFQVGFAGQPILQAGAQEIEALEALILPELARQLVMSGDELFAQGRQGLHRLELALIGQYGSGSLGCDGHSAKRARLDHALLLSLWNDQRQVTQRRQFGVTIAADGQYWTLLAALVGASRLNR